jgi:formate hydrogenlyase transcriptional activator
VGDHGTAYALLVISNSVFDCRNGFGANLLRELENFGERAIILSRGRKREIPLPEFKQKTKAALASFSGSLSTLEQAEREHILRALKEASRVVGGPAGAAARLGMKRTTLHSLMRKLGIGRLN